MKTHTINTPAAVAGLILALFPVMALAAPVKAKTAPSATKTAAMYECQKCHMKVSAAVAKKDHFKDPMDGGTLTPVKPAKK